jgi:aspartate/methionine/tyrosine aminotransferase
LHAAPFRATHASKQQPLTLAQKQPNKKQPSRRSIATDDPVIVKTKRLMASAPGALSLAQGIVHWPPPPAAVAAAAAELTSPNSAVHGYGPAEGLPELREKLRAKLRADNGLDHDYDVMVTAGANQGFVNLVLALVDEGDKAALFAPYYFNHVMALQVTVCLGAGVVWLLVVSCEY